MKEGRMSTGRNQPDRLERDDTEAPSDELLDDILGELRGLVEAGLLRPVYQGGAIRWSINDTSESA